MFLHSAIQAQVTPDVYYPFTGNANDAGSHKYNGAVVGATLVPDMNGNPNSAYSFGSNSHISLPPLTYNCPTQFTMSMLVKIQSSGTILYFSDATIDHIGLQITGNSLYLFETNQPAGICGGGAQVTATCPVNTWVQIVIVAGGMGYGSYPLALYINGTKTSTTANVPQGYVIPNLNMCTQNYIGYGFTGMIDEVKFYSGVLTDAQIAQLASSFLAGHISYGYDAAGNRILRVIKFPALKSAPADDFGQDNPKFEEKLGNQQILIYPNPTSGNVTIEIKGGEADVKTSVNLFDLYGKLLVSKTTMDTSIPVDLTGYPSGAYILKISVGDKVSDWKILKE
jgi:hypothetical protein